MLFWWLLLLVDVFNMFNYIMKCVDELCFDDILSVLIWHMFWSILVPARVVIENVMKFDDIFVKWYFEAWFHEFHVIKLSWYVEKLWKEHDAIWLREHERI
jgi:hypothetical protein